MVRLPQIVAFKWIKTNSLAALWWIQISQIKSFMKGIVLYDVRGKFVISVIGHLFKSTQSRCFSFFFCMFVLIQSSRTIHQKSLIDRVQEFRRYSISFHFENFSRWMSESLREINGLSDHDDINDTVRVPLSADCGAGNGA